MADLLDIILAQASPGDLVPADPAAMEAFMKQMGAKPSKTVPVAPAAPAAPAPAPAPDPLKLKQNIKDRMKGTSLFEPIYTAAQGGSFGTGDKVLVGENGPELVEFNQPGTVTPAGGFDLMGLLRALARDPLTKIDRAPGGLGASKIDRRGPMMGVPQEQYLATGAKPAAAAANVPAPVATPATGVKPTARPTGAQAVPGAAPTPPLAPPTPEEVINQQQKLHDMIKGLTKPAPPILGARG